MEDPDSLLIINIQSGQEDGSFNRLTEKYQHHVYNFCYRFLGNREDADDCSQEIFIRLFEHIHEFRFRSSFSTWLYRIMVNACKDMSGTRKHRILSVRLEDLGRGKNSGYKHPQAAFSDPVVLLARKEFGEAFLTGLSRMKEKQRTILILRDVDGHSYEEISHIMGLRLGTVRSTLARARYQMATYLTEFRHEL